MAYTSKYTGQKIDEAVGKALGFDIDGDGVVDKSKEAETAKDAEMFGGKLPKEYATSEDFDTFKEEVEETFKNTSTAITFTNITVPVTAWVEDLTTLDADIYPYKAEITLEGVTAEHDVDVDFSAKDAISGFLSMGADTEAGKVIIYATSLLEEDVTIYKIRCEK